MKKTESFLVRFDPETKQLADKKAESLGLSVSAYIRMLVRLDNKPEQDEPRRRKK